MDSFVVGTHFLHTRLIVKKRATVSIRVPQSCLALTTPVQPQVHTKPRTQPKGPVTRPTSVNTHTHTDGETENLQRVLWKYCGDMN